MKRLPAEKYNLAWFKLAEFVSRGEKERALGLYRLLIHSFDDYALGCQLAGDLLLAFNDTEAMNKYKQAAELYKKGNRLLEAAAVYEHLAQLQSTVSEYLLQLLEIYSTLAFDRQYYDTLFKYSFLFMQNQQYQELVQVLIREEQKRDTDLLKYAGLCERLLLNSFSLDPMPIESLDFLLHKALEILSRHDSAQLTSFLKKLGACNQEYHQKAQHILGALKQ